MTDNSQRENVVPARATRLTPDVRSRAVLLDLSGDKKASMEWAARRLVQPDVKPINKSDLKWTSKRQALARVRALKPSVFALFTPDLNLQSGLGALMLFAVCAGARQVVIGDRHGRTVSRSRLSVMLIQAPRFLLEVLVGYGWVVPLSWLLTELLRISLSFREVVQASRNKKRAAANPRRSTGALYIRATLAIAAEGGMSTHVAGFASGAATLGHPLRVLVSGEHSNNDDLSIAPSLLLSATRALFELWNNLVFTVDTLRLIPAKSARSGEIDLIYQRYNRFNWTGVALSLATGLPLALEFNGSEIWLSENWDPVGLVWLLRRFERLNLRAADQIFVVSEVERGNLLAAGIPPGRITVNPNGVDISRFGPACGGGEVRAALGVSDNIVVGFVGTFGPWHGAPVLAEAVARVSESARCHFLFIGDGEQRSAVESIIDSAGKNSVVTFAGRIAHSQVASYLDACDVFAAPNVRSGDGSEFFGSPTKLFEYMAMARPVIGSRVGQIADVIEDGSNGLLVEPGDPEALARAIEKLAADEELREKLGRAARQTVIERYTWKHNAARVFDTMLEAEANT